MMTLYQRQDCPFCWKVRLALAELNIKYHSVDLSLSEKHPQVLKHNPSGTVPVLVDGDTVIWESTVMLEYLDEAYAAGQLYRGSVAQRSQHRLLIRYADKVIGPALRRQVFEKRSKPEAEWEANIIADSDERWRCCLQQLEVWFGEHSSMTATFSAADCALLPRFGLAQAYQADQCYEDGTACYQSFPILQRWFYAAIQRDCYQEAYPSHFIRYVV